MLKTQTPRVMSGSCAENLRHPIRHVTQKNVRVGSGLLCYNSTVVGNLRRRCGCVIKRVWML